MPAFEGGVNLTFGDRGVNLLGRSQNMGSLTEHQPLAMSQDFFPQIQQYPRCSDESHLY